MAEKPLFGKRQWVGLAILLTLFAAGWWYSGSQVILQTLVGQTMGTTYQVKFWLAKPIDPASLKTAIDQRLVAINQVMSTYQSDSELSRLNNNSALTVKLSDELQAIIQLAQRISHQSQGAFDVTVGPLVNLWGFGPTQQPEKIPDNQTLQQAHQRSGYRQMTIENGHATRPLGLEVDLSAIAKGYGVDEVGKLLEHQGITNYLVEIGGELRARGQRPNNKPWRVAIEQPDPTGKSIALIVKLSDQSIATSGDYHNYFQWQGKRYSHAIDPRTGWPVSHGTTSVTVLHPSATMADAWATALLVLGAGKGVQVAQQQGLAAYFIMNETTGFRSVASPAFESFIDYPEK